MPKLIRNTYAGWVSSNPVLAVEDTGFERDTGRSKIGDGAKAWNDLNYFNEGSVVEEARPGPYSSGSAAALQPFRAALAKRITVPCNIVVMGDSTDEGTGAGTTAADRRKSWPDRLAALLRSRYPTPGETVEAAANYLPSNTGSPLLVPVVKGGVWAGSTNYGANAFTARSQSAGNTLTFSLPAGSTGFEVLSLGHGGITGYTVAIDGGAASATQGLGVGIKDGYKSALFTVTPGVAHTVVVTSVGSNNYIHGLAVYGGNETKGIRVFNCGKHGSRAEQYRSGGQYGWVPAVPSESALNGVQSLQAFAPDLLVVGWGINDYSNSAPDVSDVQLRTYLENIISAARITVPAKELPVLVLGKYRPNIAQSGLGSWDEYRAALGALDAADPLTTFLDLTKLMPDASSTRASQIGLYADTLHANSFGYQMMADAVASLVGP